jgi:hypothetical protein
VQTIREWTRSTRCSSRLDDLPEVRSRVRALRSSRLPERATFGGPLLLARMHAGDRAPSDVSVRQASSSSRKEYEDAARRDQESAFAFLLIRVRSSLYVEVSRRMVH